MFSEKDKRRVVEEIEQIRAEVTHVAQQPPPNEATTCSWVIEPLLLAVGYRRTDWIKESSDLGNNRYKPDYTVLPWTEHRWLLEAKAWSHPLAEHDANQLTSYANVNHIRWAVLTNGKEWQLYDASIFGTVLERLMAQAAFDQPEALAELLLALSLRSVKEGSIERFARRSRMDREMRAQFADENSPMVQAITASLKERTKINYSPQEVVEYLLAIAKGDTTSPPLPPPPSIEETLAQLYTHSHDLLFSTPCALVFPDGTEIKEKHWRRILFRAIEKWGQRHTIPVPLLMEGSKSYYLTNHEPVHPNGRPFERAYEMKLAQQTFYVNTFLEASRVVRELHHLATHFGEDPSKFVARYYPGQRKAKA